MEKSGILGHVKINTIFQKYFKPKFPVLLHIKEFFKVKSAIFLQEMQFCDLLLLIAGLMQTNNVAKCLPLFCSPDILKNTPKGKVHKKSEKK